MSQKEILNIIANNIWKKIYQEVNDAKFSMLVEEAIDEYTKKKMVIISRI